VEIAINQGNATTKCDNTFATWLLAAREICCFSFLSDSNAALRPCMFSRSRGRAKPCKEGGGRGEGGDVSHSTKTHHWLC